MEGCIKFEESLRLDPGVGTSFNLADCQERIGRTASAWARFLEVATATKLEGQAERERVSRARAAALEPRLSRLTIDVGANVDGLVIERDGVRVEAAAFGVAVPIDPGEHVVTARAPSCKPWSQTLTIAGGAATAQVLVPPLETIAQAVEPVAISTVTRKSSPPRASPSLGVEQRRSLSAPALVLGSLGAVVLSTAGVFALRLSSDNEEAKALCPASLCANQDEKARHDSLVDEARRDRAVAFIATGAGVAALAAAAYLYVRPRSATARLHSAWYVPRPVPGPLALHFGTEW